MNKPKIQLSVITDGNVSFTYPASAKEQAWVKDLQSADFPTDNANYYAFRKTAEGNLYSIITTENGKSTVLTLFTGQWKANKGKNIVETLQNLSAGILHQQIKADIISEQLYFLASTLVADNIPAGNSYETAVCCYDDQTQLEKFFVNTLQKDAIDGKRIIFAENGSSIANQYDNIFPSDKLVYTINSSKITSGVAVDKEYVAEGEKLHLTYTKEGEYQPIEIDVEIDGVSNQYLLYNGSEILIRSILSSLQFQEKVPEPVVPVMPIVEEEEPEEEEVAPVITQSIPYEEEEEEEEEEENDNKHSGGFGWILPLLTFLFGLAIGAGAMFFLKPTEKSELAANTDKTAAKNDTVFVTKSDTISRTDTVTVEGKTKVEYKTKDKVVYKTVNKPVYVNNDDNNDRLDRNVYRPAGESASIDDAGSEQPVVQGHGPEYPGGDEAMKNAIMRNQGLAQYAVKSGSPNATVLAEFTVEADGTVSNITTKGQPQLKSKVEAAIRRLHFEAATNGKSAKKTVTLQFRI